mmetsp:Transcript_2717/g.8109  ORF Transcript_2717/g.8109 Transcript_2717/m.8109 type:complete len:221 (+) Transcript_2717:180-842(+)
MPDVLPFLETEWSVIDAAHCSRMLLHDEVVQPVLLPLPRLRMYVRPPPVCQQRSIHWLSPEVDACVGSCLVWPSQGLLHVVPAHKDPALLLPQVLRRGAVEERVGLGEIELRTPKVALHGQVLIHEDGVRVDEDHCAVVPSGDVMNGQELAPRRMPLYLLPILMRGAIACVQGKLETIAMQLCILHVQGSCECYPGGMCMARWHSFGERRAAISHQNGDV